LACFGVDDMGEADGLIDSLGYDGFVELVYECKDAWAAYIRPDYSECRSEFGAEICTSQEGDIFVCHEQLDGCWYGEYDDEGFVVEAKYGRDTLVCDWDGECLGFYDEESDDFWERGETHFFVVTGGEVV